MQMQAVHGLARHDVYPAVAHGEPALAEVHLQVRDEGFDVLVDAALEFAEGRGEAVQLVHGAVRSVTAGIVLLRPIAACIVKVADLVAFLEKVAIESFGAGFVQRFVIDKGGEPRFDAHAQTLAESDGTAKLGGGAIIVLFRAFTIAHQATDP